MKTLACVLATALLTTEAAEPPKPQPLAGWLGVFPELPGYARTFEEPLSRKVVQSPLNSQKARYEWTGGALKSVEVKLLRADFVQELWDKGKEKGRMQVRVGKYDAQIMHVTEGEDAPYWSMLIRLAQNKSVGIVGTGMVTEEELVTMAGRFDLDAIAKALDAPPRTDFTRKKGDFARLCKGTSLADVTAFVGEADADIGSGIHVMQYKLPDGGEVLLGFADFKSLMYVKYKGGDDKIEDLVK